MKARTSFLKRCLAFALALVLLASSANMGIVTRVNAEGTSITAGEIVANNYALSNAEKALLSSGLLAGDSIEYTVPSDGNTLINVDTENAKITAKTEGEWIPESAEIIANGATEDTIVLVNGEGKYNPAVGNAFSVKVKYVLYTDIDNQVQETLLNTGAWLKAGVANLANAYKADVNLGTVVLAMDTLKQLAAGISMDFGSFSMSAQFGADAIAAVNSLAADVAANNGQLILQVKNVAYNNSTSKTQYLLENGAAYEETLVNTYNALNAIKNDPLANNQLLDDYLKGSDPASYTQWMAFKNILSNLVDTMKPAVEGDWTAADKGTALIVSYEGLDDLVAALGGTSANTVKNPLKVAEVSVQKNMSMFNVTVKVVMNEVVDKPDSAELKKTEAEPVVLTMGKDATAEAIIAEAKATVDAALAAWDAYEEGHYSVTTSELPGTLNADIDYVVTYSPKNYTITYGYVDASAPTSVPYGYQYTLPKHNDTTKAYDYTVNGENKAQGEVIVIEKDTEIKRTSGKAYANTDLYTIVADNFGNDVAKAILKSGALLGNEAVNVRKPDPADVVSLLTLENGKLTANNYNAAYANLEWIPYTYGSNGDENRFSGNEATGISNKEVKMQYILALTNFGQDKAQSILNLAATLKDEAEEQKGAMDSLAGMKSTLVQLDKTKLGALNGVIDVTDFTEGDGTDTDEENLSIRAEMKSIVSAIIANNLGANNYLKIYNMVEAYGDDGMSYYYKNYGEIKAEVSSLSGYLSNLMDNEEALIVMCTAAGYGEYADKIADVETKLNSYNARLSAPNVKIDVESENLGKLVAALIKEGYATGTADRSPYLLSETLTALSADQVNVQIIIETPIGNETVTTSSMDRGTILTQEVVNGLMADADEKVFKLLGENIAYYVPQMSGKLNDYVGKEIDSNVSVTYTFVEKEYTVKIDGEADQTVTISDLEINLPKHPDKGWVYKYTVDGEEDIEKANYTFTTEQLDRLFAGGSYTITRVAINEGEEKLETTFADWLVKDTDGNVTGLFADVDGNKDGVMGFAMKIVESGYTYIGLNNEPLLYMNEEDTLEIKLQTLINALMNDDQFGSDTLINLGKNSKGEFVHASMQLGNDANDIVYEDLDFTLYLNSVPGMMVTASNAMETIKPYMSFKSNSEDDLMDLNINLPEKVYEVYLAAMLATENVTKDNMEAINSEIAFQFLWDYVELIMATEANTTTYTNTLAMLGKEYDLTGYEEHYQLVKKALTNPGVVVNPDENGEFDMSVTANGQKAIDGLINLIGIDVSAYETYMGMISEYKGEGKPITAAARANLLNTEKNFEAALIDLDASGVTNKFDFTNDLPARVAQIADKAAVILLDTVDGDLTFKGTTILDLNGQTVNGSITSNGTLIIVDSALDTDNGGKVTGSVSGNVQIIAGSYDSDVSAFLKDGYKQVNGAVQNTLYSIESNGNDVCFVLNPDVMSEDFPNVKALAVDIAADLVLNYYTAAALTAEGNGLYNVNIDDLIDLINSTNKVDDLIVKVLNSVDVSGMSGFANAIIEDLLDFGALADALVNETEIASYNLSTAPWTVTVEHKTDDDYITFGIGSNLNQKTRAAGKSFNVSLKFSKKCSEENKLVKLLRELDNVVNASATVNLEQPTYDGTKNALSIVGNAAVDATLTLNKDSNYATILAVILANGGATEEDNLVAAVNAGDMVALKKAIDNTTVAELFTALKVLNRSDKFATVAKNVGVTVDVEGAAELEDLYHLFLCAGGKVLEELDITGMNSKFGALDTDGDGVYEFNEDATRKPSASARGYSVYAEATVAVKLTVALFGEEDCLLGDVNHDGEITERDAAMILRHCVGETPAIFCFYGADVNGDGEITERDASIILKYCVEDNYVFPAARN